MIDESKILEYAQELLPEREEDKPEEEVKEIIRRYLIEKGVTQHLTENQIRAIVRQYLIDEGILIPPKPDIDPEPTPGKLFPTLVIHSSSQDRSITVGNSKTYSIDVTSDGVLSVSSSSPTVATVTRSGNSITVTGIASGNATIYLTVSETDTYYAAQTTLSVHVGLIAGGRYGYRIKKNEPDPYARVEYLFDAVGLTPVHMDFTTEVFDYGDWANKWFVTNNRPLMLKGDGTVDYYLDANDYTLKEDGTASDVANVEYDGNAMVQIPLVWVYRYEDEEYEYEIISDVQYDDNYHAYAHTRADGSIADYFYMSMFAGSFYGTDGPNRIRSLSGQTQSVNQTAQEEIECCQHNGTANWYTHTWSQRELIRTLLILLGKSTNISAVFGDGTSSMFTTGTLVKKGQFFGCNDGSKEVKVFHMEKFWGGRYDRVAGVLSNQGDIYVKMTPEDAGYKINDVIGYSDTGLNTGISDGFITGMKCSKYGLIPINSDGNNTRTEIYYGSYASMRSDAYLMVAGVGVFADGLHLGAVNFILSQYSDEPFIGCSLSCEMPAA